jgi:hypothetical protein
MELMRGVRDRGTEGPKVILSELPDKGQSHPLRCRKTGKEWDSGANQESGREVKMPITWPWIWIQESSV